MRDELRKFGHFAFWTGAGFVLWLCLTSCGATPAQIKETGHFFGSFLPAPIGGIAESLATVVATFAAYKGGRHIHKRLKASREAKKALHASRPPQA